MAAHVGIFQDVVTNIVKDAKAQVVSADEMACRAKSSDKAVVSLKAAKRRMTNRVDELEVENDRLRSLRTCPPKPGSRETRLSRRQMIPLRGSTEAPLVREMATKKALLVENIHLEEKVKRMACLKEK